MKASFPGDDPEDGLRFTGHIVQIDHVGHEDKPYCVKYAQDGDSKWRSQTEIEVECMPDEFPPDPEKSADVASASAEVEASLEKELPKKRAHKPKREAPKQKEKQEPQEKEEANDSADDFQAPPKKKLKKADSFHAPEWPMREVRSPPPNCELGGFDTKRRGLLSDAQDKVLGGMLDADLKASFARDSPLYSILEQGHIIAPKGSLIGQRTTKTVTYFKRRVNGGYENNHVKVGSTVFDFAPMKTTERGSVHKSLAISKAPVRFAFNAQVGMEPRGSGVLLGFALQLANSTQQDVTALVWYDGINEIQRFHSNLRGFEEQTCLLSDVELTSIEVTGSAQLLAAATAAAVEENQALTPTPKITAAAAKKKSTAEQRVVALESSVQTWKTKHEDLKEALKDEKQNVKDAKRDAQHYEAELNQEKKRHNETKAAMTKMQGELSELQKANMSPQCRGTPTNLPLVRTPADSALPISSQLPSDDSRMYSRDDVDRIVQLECSRRSATARADMEIQQLWARNSQPQLVSPQFMHRQVTPIPHAHAYGPIAGGAQYYIG